MVRLAGTFGVLVVLGGAAQPTAAQEPAAPTQHLVVKDAVKDAALFKPETLDTAHASEQRPAALVPLYAAFVATQALDVHSSRRAIANGGVEGNPLMKGIAGSSLAMIAVKAAGTTAVIAGSERLWKRNKPAAIVMMIAANSTMAWVVQHNYRALR